MCGSMVDTQCLTAEIRRENKKRKKKPEDENIYVGILLCRAAINYGLPALGLVVPSLVNFDYQLSQVW